MERIVQSGEDKGKIVFIDHQRRLSRIVASVNEIKIDLTYLKDKLIELDGAIQDNLHYIEMSDLDVQRAYKVYKKLQQLRIERRLVKNELEQCEIAFNAVSSMDLILPNINKGISKIQIKNNEKEKFYYVRSKEHMVFDDFENQQLKYALKLKKIVCIK